MFETYTPDTISGSDNPPMIQPTNTSYVSYINQSEWDMLMELISCGRTAGIMAGTFEDKTHKGRVQKLDKEKLEKFDIGLKKVIHKLALQCNFGLKPEKEAQNETVL